MNLDLALDDLKQGDVSLTHASATLDERGTARGELLDALGDHVDQDRDVFDDQGGLFNEFCFHRREAVFFHPDGLGDGARTVVDDPCLARGKFTAEAALHIWLRRER